MSTATLPRGRNQPGRTRRDAPKLTEEEVAVTAATAARAAAEAELARAQNEVNTAVRGAHAAGISVSDLLDAVGVRRARIYQILKEEGAAPAPGKGKDSLEQQQQQRLAAAQTLQRALTTRTQAQDDLRTAERRQVQTMVTACEAGSSKPAISELTGLGVPWVYTLLRGHQYPTLTPPALVEEKSRDTTMRGVDLRAARDWLGYGARAMAEILGVEAVQLRHWETSNEFVPSRVAEAIHRLQEQARAVMTGAELRLARERLGLSTDDFAAMFDVDVRNLRRWELDAIRVPPGLAHDVRVAGEDADDDVAELVAAARAADPPVLVTYQSSEDYQRLDPLAQDVPFSWHRRVLQRAQEALPQATVVYADSPPSS